MSKKEVSREGAHACNLVVGLFDHCGNSTRVDAGQATRQVDLLRCKSLDQWQPGVRRMPRGQCRIHRDRIPYSTLMGPCTKVRWPAASATTASSAYATQSPILGYEIEKKEALFSGGNFWDGRATGELLGNAAADQAQGPFLNPLEQALPSPVAVVSRVCGSTYASLFLSVWGANACDANKVNAAFDYIALSIAAFEASPESNAFTSKYDYFLKGVVDLTKGEKKGLAVFKGKGKCANCHTLNPNGKGSIRHGNHALPLLTDFTYDNIGVPRNPENPFYDQPIYNPLGKAWIDLGLGEFLATRVEYQQFAAENYGKQRSGPRCGMSTSAPMPASRSRLATTATSRV